MTLPWAAVLGIRQSAESLPPDPGAISAALQNQGYRIRRTVITSTYPVDIAREIRRLWMDKVETIITVGALDSHRERLMAGLGMAWDRLATSDHSDAALLVGMECHDLQSGLALVVSEPPRTTVTISETTDPDEALSCVVD